MSHIFVDIATDAGSSAGAEITDRDAAFTVIDGTDDFTIPANAYAVQIKCIGGLDPNQASTLNSVNVYPGFEWSAKEDTNGTQRVRLANALVVVTNGNRWTAGYLI